MSALASKATSHKDHEKNNRKKVLVVHSDGDLSEFRDLIHGSDMDFTFLNNGYDAMRSFYRHKGNFDAIICGLVMPKMDGFSFVARVRPLTDAPVILLSKRSGLDAESVRYFENLGVKDFVPEETPEQLEEVLRKVSSRKSSD